MSLKKNLLKNGIASAVSKGVVIFQQLFLVPFFLSAWGAAYYGEWLTLTIIPTMLAFSDLGFGTAAANSLVLTYASGEKQKAANIAKTGVFIITLMIICGILISALLVFVLDYYGVFEKSLIERQDAILAISILMVARILNFYQQLFDAYYRSARRASLSINLLSLQSALIILSGLFVLLSGGGIVQFALVNLLVAIVFNPLYAYIAKKVLALHKTHSGIVKKKEIREITGKGLGYLMSPIWQAILFQGTTFVVRILLGPEAVAIFNTVRTVTRVVNQAYSMIISTFLPELQFEIGAGNMGKARKVFRVSLGLSITIALAGSFFLYFFGLWFYELWTSNALKPPNMMWNIFISGIIFNAIWWTTSFVFTAMNKPYEMAVAGVIAASISVIISYFFAKYFGLTGAAIGSVIMDVLLFLYIFPKSCKLLEQSLSSLFKEIILDYKDFWTLQLKPKLFKK
ncbi:polysaccharide biosynthesis C-terminal domain-containing protein [Wenyingzhuangia sp. 1_MG-2023]|nr:polysaccharide biosynthesis C-terminal domain-containing protein [Wenyingzhuangia sp. 1_MG-2023]